MSFEPAIDWMHWQALDDWKHLPIGVMKNIKPKGNTIILELCLW